MFKLGLGRIHVQFTYTFSSILVSGNICRPLITFANSLDPDQDQQNFGPDLDPNGLTL